MRPRDVGRRAGELGAAFATSGAIQLLNVLTGVLLARSLGPEGRGELAAVLLWPTALAVIGGLGVHEAATYRAARGGVPVATLAGTAAALALAQATALVVIGAAVLPFVLADYDSSTVVVAYAALAYIPVYLLNMQAMSLLNGLHRNRAFQSLRLALFCANATVLVLLAVGGVLDVAAAAAAYIGAHLVITIAAGVLVRRAAQQPLRADRHVARDLIGFGLRSHLSTSSSLLNNSLDQLLISVFLGPVKLGLYVIALTLTSLTALVGSSAAMVGLPRIAAIDDPHRRALAAARLIGFTLTLGTAVSLPLLIAAPQVIELFFGADFAAAASASRVLLVAAVFLALRRTLDAILKGAGRPLQAGIAELVALAFTIAGLAVLLPAFGLIGAAVASLLAYAAALAWLAHATVRTLGVPLAQVLRPTASPL